MCESCLQGWPARIIASLTHVVACCLWVLVGKRLSVEAPHVMRLVGLEESTSTSAVSVWICVSLCASTRATHSPALVTGHTCAVRGGIAQLPAVARRSLCSLAKCGQIGGGEEIFRSQLLRGGEYAIMKQQKTPLPSTRATSPDVRDRDTCLQSILWSVLLSAGANSSRGKKVMRSRRHHVEAVNPPKHPDCGESSIDIHVLTTPGGLSDGMTTSDAISKSLEIPVMICRIASQPGPVWRIRARPGHQTQDRSRGTRYRQCDPSTNMVTFFGSKQSPAVRRVYT